MFAARYFAPRYFAPRYFAEAGSGTSGTSLDLLQWIDSRFDDPTFATAFPGGVHFQRQEPGNATRPYVIVDLLSESPVWNMDDTYGETVQVQFTIVCDSIPEARQLRDVITRHATAGLDSVADADLGAGDRITSAMRTGGVTTFDTKPNPDAGEAVLATVDYVFSIYRGA